MSKGREVMLWVLPGGAEFVSSVIFLTQEPQLEQLAVLGAKAQVTLVD